MHVQEGEEENQREKSLLERKKGDCLLYQESGTNESASRANEPYRQNWGEKGYCTAPSGESESCFAAEMHFSTIVRKRDEEQEAHIDAGSRAIFRGGGTIKSVGGGKRADLKLQKQGRSRRHLLGKPGRNHYQKAHVLPCGEKQRPLLSSQRHLKSSFFKGGGPIWEKLGDTLRRDAGTSDGPYRPAPFGTTERDGVPEVVKGGGKRRSGQVKGCTKQASDVGSIRLQQEGKLLLSSQLPSVCRRECGWEGATKENVAQRKVGFFLASKEPVWRVWEKSGNHREDSIRGGRSCGGNPLPIGEETIVFTKRGQT